MFLSKKKIEICKTTPMKHEYRHVHWHTNTANNLKKNHIIKCNYMCRCRVGVGHDTYSTPRHT